jgi:hypothetical protein
MVKKTVQLGRIERRAEASFVSHLEALNDASTTLAVFAILIGRMNEGLRSSSPSSSWLFSWR